jgi:hypothetical protein
MCALGEDRDKSDSRFFWSRGSGVPMRSRIIFSWQFLVYVFSVKFCPNLHAFTEIKGQRTGRRTVSPSGIYFNVLYTRKRCDRDRLDPEILWDSRVFRPPPRLRTGVCWHAISLPVSQVSVSLWVYATLAPERFYGFYWCSVFYSVRWIWTFRLQK